jgi:hypothetical protein
MQQLGHTDPGFTLRVYAHMMRRSEDERDRPKALVEGHVCARVRYAQHGFGPVSPGDSWARTRAVRAALPTTDTQSKTKACLRTHPAETIR